MAAANENSDIIMLWSPPRSVSTSLLKGITNVANSQAWHEPYWMTFQCSNYGKHRKAALSMLSRAWVDKHGEVDTDSIGSEIAGGYWAAGKSYTWLKDQLESIPPDDKNIVFCKDFAAGLEGMYEYLPDGFRHSFLIRHPYKVLESWERMINRGIKNESKRVKISELPECLLPPGLFFKEQYDLYQHVKEHYVPNPVIIDTDDLLAAPCRVLKAYCQIVGIPYNDDLLQWKSGRECMDQQWMVAKEQIYFSKFANSHMETFASTCFGKPTKVPDRAELSDDVRHCSDVCLKYYEAMYAKRLEV
ncbi:uncharacterized protein [Amphiura filiformis]|uniref:uncharacterized protein n=1 Tax=Amphiura filiformis TaxID=82378 RepID=UPI003B212D74